MSNACGAVVVFSGGQDSATCLAQALRDYGRDRVFCVTFRYGQRHAAEVEVARRIAGDWGVAEHQIVDLPCYGQLTSSALLDATQPIQQAPGARCPNTVVEGRNMLFLLLAAIYAKNRGVHDLIAGMSQADFSGYPDCRQVFVEACRETLQLAMDWPFRILTPLMHLTKAQTWELADRLGVLTYVAEQTLTCYNGVVGAGCGHCPGCVLRRRGYEAYIAQSGKLC